MMLVDEQDLEEQTPDQKLLNLELFSAFEVKEMEPLVREGLLNIKKTLSINASDLFFKWESFSVEKGFSAIPNLEQLLEFQSWILASKASTNENIMGSGSLIIKAGTGNTVSLKKKMLTKDSISSVLAPRGLPNIAAATPFKPTMGSGPAGDNLDHLSSPAPFSSAFSPGFKRPTASATQTSLPAVKTDFASLFKDRKQKGKREAVFADHITFPPRSANDSFGLCQVSVVEGQQTKGYRYMYEKLAEKGDLLNERINFFASLFAADIIALRKKSDDEAPSEEKVPEQEELSSGQELLLFGHPSMVSQEAQFYIGRISCDTVVEGTRLNLQSLVLETSREIGAGARVKIDFGGLIAKGIPLNLFPGQIVCVEAANPSGNCLCVLSLLDPPKLSPPVSYGNDYKTLYPEEKRSDLSILFASGPYTLNDSMEYEALDELIDVAIKESPNLLLLMGPFVDIDHPLFDPNATVDQELTFEEVFRLKFAQKLEKVKKVLPHVQIVLVPSQKEATLEWIAYPQPPIGSCIREEAHAGKLQELGLMNRNGEVWANLFPNPVQFTCNEVVIALSNLDTIRDLIQLGMTVNPAPAPKVEGEESKPNPPRDKFTTCFTSILSQRHFYPVFPPTAGACIDSTRALGSQPQDPCVLQVRPDILILPSRLQYAIKTVDDCLCINPGYLVKGRTGGTYCKIQVHAMDTSSMDDTDCFQNHVSERSRVEIIKL